MYLVYICGSYICSNYIFAHYSPYYDSIASARITITREEIHNGVYQRLNRKALQNQSEHTHWYESTSRGVES